MVKFVTKSLPPDVYALVNHCKAAKDIWDRVKLLMQGIELSYQECECKLYNEFDKFTSIKGELLHEYYLRFAQLINDMHTIGMTIHPPPSVPQNAYHSPSISQQPPVEFPQIDLGLAVSVFLPGDDPIMMAGLLFNKFKEYRVKVLLGEGHMARQCTQPKRPRNSTWFKENILLIDDLDAYDFDYDDISSAKAVLMANLSSYDSNVVSEDRCSLKQEIDSLKQTLSKQIKKNELLLQTFTIFKKESKERENKNMDKEIDLEKKRKELDNIVYKVGQSVQTVHMLTKPQVFYDDTYKQALVYQNLFYLKKAQRIKPTLYDGIVLFNKHDVISMVDEEETLILEEESRSKMFAKQNDPMLKKK
ncbi:hypothetical protein Tco_1453798, partial [Tanacetum coccineum]